MKAERKFFDPNVMKSAEEIQFSVLPESSFCGIMKQKVEEDGDAART